MTGGPGVQYTGTVTTWWREAEEDGDDLAFSIRPDIWPAGSHCWSMASARLALADWGGEVWDTPDEANGVPGAAEALILAGQVVHGYADPLEWAWTEIPDPQRAG